MEPANLPHNGRESETETEAERGREEAHHRSFKTILGREGGCCKETLVVFGFLDQYISHRGLKRGLRRARTPADVGRE
jgi:hypothetical protein